MSTRFRIRDIDLFERPVPFERPFRFGAVTIADAAQAFVRVEIEIEGKGVASGASAELMVPKWFDKNPALTPEETVDELRHSLDLARNLYLAERNLATAFGHHAACIKAQVETCKRRRIPALAAAFGPAEIDKAILDALLRALGQDVFKGFSQNVIGLDSRLTPDLHGGIIAKFLAIRAPKSRMPVRHTVGMLDRLDGEHGLEAIVRETGCRYFKIKLSGNPHTDVARLTEIAQTLESLRVDYEATVDANEQYADSTLLEELCHELDSSPELHTMRRRLLYIEQPMPREITHETSLGTLADRFDFIIDEADDAYDAFPVSAKLGYRGVSSKSCKGLYKALLNGARAAAWTAEGHTKYFLAAEDLTCQAGLALQQDSALVAFLGIGHAERNGHHYARGFAGAPQAEAERFLVAHPDLYIRTSDEIRLSITDGALSIGSLATCGFGSAAEPDWTTLASMPVGNA